MQEPREQLLHRDVPRFRGGLVFKAHGFCVSLSSRRESHKEGKEPSAELRRQTIVACRLLTEMCSGSETGSYVRLIDSCITQLQEQGPSRTCNGSKEEKQKFRVERSRFTAKRASQSAS